MAERPGYGQVVIDIVAPPCGAMSTILQPLRTFGFVTPKTAAMSAWIEAAHEDDDTAEDERRIAQDKGSTGADRVADGQPVSVDGYDWAFQFPILSPGPYVLNVKGQAPGWTDQTEACSELIVP